MGLPLPRVLEPQSLVSPKFLTRHNLQVEKMFTSYPFNECKRLGVKREDISRPSLLLENSYTLSYITRITRLVRAFSRQSPLKTQIEPFLPGLPYTIDRRIKLFNIHLFVINPNRIDGRTSVLTLTNYIQCPFSGQTQPRRATTSLT